MIGNRLLPYTPVQIPRFLPLSLIFASIETAAALPLRRRCRRPPCRFARDPKARRSYPGHGEHVPYACPTRRRERSERGPDIVRLFLFAVIAASRLFRTPSLPREYRLSIIYIY